MAIKGKARTKSKVKQVTRGPKPAYVQVTPPWFGRKRVQLVIALLLGIGIYLFGIWVTNGLREQKAEKDAKARKSREVAAMQQYTAVADPELQKVGTQNPQQPSVFVLVPDMTQVAQAMASKDVEPSQLVKTFHTMAKNDGAAADALEKIDLAKMIADKGFTYKISHLMFSSRDGMVRGLRLQQSSLLLLEQAVATEGDLRAQLVQRATKVSALAVQIFSAAYQDYYEAQLDLKLALPGPAAGAPGGVSGIPGGSGVPGG